MKLRLVSVFALSWGIFLLSQASTAAAAPRCDQEAVEDGSLIYTQVVDAKPIRTGPAYGKALLPKRTMGAKLYVHPKKGISKEYLHHAAVCHAASDAPPAFQGDPLRVDGDIRKIRVHSAGHTLVLTIMADDPGTGRQIWERARALIVDVDGDRAKAAERKSTDL